MEAFVVRTMALPPASLLSAVPQPADAAVRTDETRLQRVP
jgi:hypothetical protein